MAVRVRQKNRDEEWNRNMGNARQQQDKDMLAMALKMNDQQAIGYLIGALGKKLWMDHLARRHAREDADRLKEGQLTKGDGAEWTRQDVDWYKRSGGDMQGASPDTVAVVTSQGEVNPRFATPDVEPKAAETSIGYIDPSNNYQVSPLQSPENRYYDLLNQRMNPELSSDALRKALFGGRYF
jgi:hypothetical protein